MSLPADTIAEGCHVLLDVRNHKLVLAKPMRGATIVERYEVHDDDAALDLFEYLETHKQRFGSVKIV